jgi:hypothetical protein
MIPIYTTSTVPVAGAGRVQQAWPVWTESDDIGRGLDQLARAAIARGAHAVIGLQLTFERDSYDGTTGRTTHYVLLGTAVTLGPAA